MSFSKAMLAMGAGTAVILIGAYGLVELLHAVIG